jgi:hypothetical protein
VEFTFSIDHLYIHNPNITDKANETVTRLITVVTKVTVDTNSGFASNWIANNVVVAAEDTADTIIITFAVKLVI